jgi:hypothetical protein
MRGGVRQHPWLFFRRTGGAGVAVPLGQPKTDVPEISAPEMSEISANMSATYNCPLNGPRRPHVLVPAGPGFEPGTVVVLAQVAGAPEAGHAVRCMVLRGKDARCHVNIVADSGTKGVLGGNATNARMWLNRSDHVERCLALFDDPSWPRHGYRLHRAVPTNAAARARGTDAGLVTALARFELYVCWAGAASWASARGSWDCTIRDSTGADMPVLENGQDELRDRDGTVLYQSDATEEYASE